MTHEPLQQVLTLREARPGRRHGPRGLFDIADVGVSWDDPDVVAALEEQRYAPGRLTVRVRVVTRVGPVHVVGTTVDLDAAGHACVAWTAEHAPLGHGAWWAPTQRVWWSTDMTLAHDLLHALQHESCAEWVSRETTV